MFARTFTSEDIDSVKRSLGQVKDLERSASAYQKELLALHEQGLGVCEIARRLGLHRKSVARAIRRAKRRV
jgi:DNA-directed RNA polymerase specialized sigma24 family protein